MFKLSKTQYVFTTRQLNQKIMMDSKNKLINSYPKKYQSNMNNPLAFLPPVTKGIIIANCAMKFWQKVELKLKMIHLLYIFAIILIEMYVRIINKQLFI